MAPPTLVRSRQDVQRLYKEQLDDPDKYHCSIRSIIQLECTFKISEANRVQETICIPFKRIFQRCLDSYVTKRNGDKRKTQRWVNIEVTDPASNDLVRATHSSEIQRFLQAEVDLAKWMETEAAKTDTCEE